MRREKRAQFIKLLCVESVLMVSLALVLTIYSGSALTGCASRTVFTAAGKTPATRSRELANTSTASEANIPDVFERARELLALTQEKRAERNNLAKNKKGKAIRGLIESEVIDYMQADPESFDEPLELLYQELDAKPKVVDPTKHVRLIPPRGQPGYSNLEFFVSHDYQLGDRLVERSNLVKVWRDFLASAKKEIILNVFEFDLDEIATALVDARKRGVLVTVGIDRNMVKDKEAVKRIYDKLKSGEVNVVEVNPIGINHQKMAAIDWSQPALARALFSSGNLTQSCLGPEGDLKDLSPRPKESIPNANHVITMRSWLAANLVNHELSKTFSSKLGLRGSSFPTTGAYQITGPGVNPETLEAYPENSFIITFTPGGGYRQVNRNLLARVIERSEGPVRMVQFAYSAAAVSEALLARAHQDYQNGRKFDFLSVGDTPFAMQGWSQFLKMSGLKRETVSTKVVGPRGGVTIRRQTSFSEDKENPWLQSLTPDQMKALRAKVRIGPKAYGNFNVLWEGRRYPVSAKVHHKLMAAGDYAVVGTSFNFSEGAETNNEQVLVFRDAQIAKIVDGIAQTLAKQSPASVYEEALRRNESRENGADDTLYDMSDASQATD